MSRYFVVAAVLLAMVSARGARADEVDQFTLQAGSYTVSFQLPASPVNPTVDLDCKAQYPPEFCFTSVPVTSNLPLPAAFDIDFFGESAGGGLDLTFGFGDYFDKSGPQLYSGTETAPTFLLGTFALTDYYNGTEASLTISQVTPEPGTLVLLGSGGLGALGVARRRWLR